MAQIAAAIQRNTAIPSAPIILSDNQRASAMGTNSKVMAG